jgi:hypothetical protein
VAKSLSFFKEKGCQDDDVSFVVVVVVGRFLLFFFFLFVLFPLALPPPHLLTIFLL